MSIFDESSSASGANTDANIGTDAGTDPSAPGAQASQRRSRRALLGLAGLGAACTGAGLAWWRYRLDAQVPGADFWRQQWPNPDGTSLSMQSFQAAPLLLNFWATWCPPCVDELPLINAFYQQNAAKGWKVLAIAIDTPQAVQAFLRKLPLGFPIAVAGASGADFARSWGNVSGALPFTVVLDARGQVVQRKLGRITAQDLEKWGGLK